MSQAYSNSLSAAYLEAIFIPVALLGVVSFVSNMIMAFSGKYADALDKLLSTKNILLFSAVSVGVLMLAQSFFISYVGVLFFLCVAFFVPLIGILTNHISQDAVSKKHRATMISMQNLFSSLGIFLIYQLVGVLIDAFSLQVAYFAVTGIYIIGMIAAWMYYMKKNLKL